jgi:hypothetical protein
MHNSNVVQQHRGDIPTHYGRLVFSVMFTMYSTHSQHSTIALYAIILYVYYSCTTMIDLLHCITLLFFLPHLLYRCTCIQVSEKKENH